MIEVIIAEFPDDPSFIRPRITRQVFDRLTVRQVLEKLRPELGGIRESVLVDNRPVWHFTRGAHVTLTGDVNIKAGYRTPKASS